MIGRIDLVGRVAFGGLCIAGMAGVAIPVLVLAGAIGGIMYLADDNGMKALAVWLGAWGAAAFAGGLLAAISYAAWPLAADWITEWQGYAAAFAIGAAGLGLMALLLFALTMPLHLAIIVPLAAAFCGGFAVAGLRPGARVTTQPQRPWPPGRRRTGVR